MTTGLFCPSLPSPPSPILLFFCLSFFEFLTHSGASGVFDSSCRWWRVATIKARRQEIDGGRGGERMRGRRRERMRGREDERKRGRSSSEGGRKVTAVWERERGMRCILCILVWQTHIVILSTTSSKKYTHTPYLCSTTTTYLKSHCQCWHSEHLRSVTRVWLQCNYRERPFFLRSSWDVRSKLCMVP